MLPFLSHKRQEGSAVQTMSPEGQLRPGESDNMGLMSAAEDLCKAIESKDHSAVASALRAAFQILDSEDK